MDGNLKTLIKALPFVGIFYIFSGIFFAVVIWNTNNPLGAYYLPIKVLTAICAYLLVTGIPPESKYNFYFLPYKPHKYQKDMVSLIAKYKNNFIVALTGVLFFICELLLGINNTQTNGAFSFIDAFFFIFCIFIMFGALFEGAKSLSAWWKIKGNVTY